jgi:anti-sigma factor RsiW
VAAGFDEEELAELAALADGSLPAGRRAEVEARVASSPELQELLERQRRALVATSALTAEEVPASLRRAVEMQRRAGGARPGRRRWFAPSLGLAAAAAATATVAAAIVLSGGPGAPTVAEAAQLATQAPTAPAPTPAGAPGARLAIAVEGVPFPDFTLAHGWRPLGARRGEVDGRDATVVYYGKDGGRLGYVIVSGDGLDPPTGGQTTSIGGVRYQTLVLNGRPAVTWRRGGHTCILVGQVSRAELLQLASYQV